MNDLIQKKTGVIQLNNGATLPCDATLNTDPTFNTELMAKIGEVMYLLSPLGYEMVTDGFVQYLGKMLLDKTCIKKVVISNINYATNCSVILQGIAENGEKESAIQELFYQSYDEAVMAIDVINQFYDLNPEGDWISDCRKYYNFNYRYMLIFPLKPQDVLLEDNMHYVANRIIVDIHADYATVDYQGHDDESYEYGKEVHSAHEYSGVRNQYEIVPLVEQKAKIFDI